MGRRKEVIEQRVEELTDEALSQELQNPTGDFSHLTSDLTIFPGTVKTSLGNHYSILASLAHANQLDLQYRSLISSENPLSEGIISEEFLAKISEVYQAPFGCYLYHAGKVAYHNWPEEYKDLDVLKLLGYTPVRPIVILGFYS